MATTCWTWATLPWWVWACRSPSAASFTPAVISARGCGTTTNLNRVAFTSGFFTAVGENGLALTSIDDGASWSSETTGATNDLIHAASGDGTLLVIGEDEVRLKTVLGWSNQLAQPDGPP